jgi:hypothetical protein
MLLGSGLTVVSRLNCFVFLYYRKYVTGEWANCSIKVELFCFLVVQELCYWGDKKTKQFNLDTTVSPLPSNIIPVIQENKTIQP